MTVKLDTAKLDQLIDQVDPRSSAHVRKTAFAVEANAKQNIERNFNRITGALLNGTMAEEKDGPLSYWVHDSVDYGIHLEFPGVTRRWEGRPFMVPAAESERANWEKGWREILK